MTADKRISEWRQCRAELMDALAEERKLKARVQALERYLADGVGKGPSAHDQRLLGEAASRVDLLMRRLRDLE